MISRVRSKNKGKQAERKNSVKKQRRTEKKTRYKETETMPPGVEPGKSARASNSFTTAPHRDTLYTHFEKLILLYQNHFSLL